MGAGVADAVGRVVVGQVLVVGAVQAKLQHLHAGEAAGLQQLPHRVKQLAQVLGHDGQVAQGGAQRAEQLHAGALLPSAVFGRGLPRRDGPVGVEPAEMVDAQDVVDAQRMAHPADPPGIAGAAVVVPVIQRVAPQLAVGGKEIRRAAGHPPGPAVGVHLKQSAAGPCVGRVRRHIDGDIPHDAHAAAVGVVFQRPPLLVKLVLHKGPKAQLVGVLVPELLQRFGVAQAVGAGPLLPVFHAVLLLDGHVQAVIRQPAVAAEGKGVPVVRVGGVAAGHRALRQKILVGFAQHRQPLLVQKAVIHPLRVGAPVQKGVVGAGQQAVRGQQVQVDQVGVARKGGAALVGAVAKAGGPDRQDLPDALPGADQEIDKPAGRRPQRADAVAARQAGQRHQDTAFTFGKHGRSLLLANARIFPSWD